MMGMETNDNNTRKHPDLPAKYIGDRYGDTEPQTGDEFPRPLTSDEIHHAIDCPDAYPSVMWLEVAHGDVIRFRPFLNNNPVVTEVHRLYPRTDWPGWIEVEAPSGAHWSVRPGTTPVHMIRSQGQ
jgi:hypothetical protein